MNIERYHSIIAALDLPTDLESLIAAPPEVRDFVMWLAAEIAAPWYENDPELTAFEAFGEEDFFDDYDAFE